MEEKRTIGYICPKCGAAVIAERSAFALSAGTAAVICDCGKSKLVLDYDGDTFHVTVPCGICGGEHTARVDAKAILTGRGVALTCPETRQYCCLMGEDGRVSAGMRELAITADKIAEEAEFFSFGTNDLTQMTFGFSRDDAGKFLSYYYEKKIYESDPFAHLDQKGVGKLVKMAAELGRKTRPTIHLGICGEHGGDPTSVEFCHKVGLNYVSCSPYRVPIARLAAAQAAIKTPR